MSGFVALEDLFKGRYFDREIVVLCVQPLAHGDLISSEYAVFLRVEWERNAKPQKQTRLMSSGLRSLDF